MTKTVGKVYLVCAGPGDLGLLTVKARELLSFTDVLVYDHLTNSKLHKWTKKDCEHFDVGKSSGSPALEQSEIGKILVSKAEEGFSVVRLMRDTPFIFERCAEEISMIEKAEIPYEIVPGVTASFACAAYAGIPLSIQESGTSICYLTGHKGIQMESKRMDFSKFAELGGIFCINMGISKLEEIVDQLETNGLSKKIPVAIVNHGTLATQRHIICSLGTLLKEANSAKFITPSIIFIGNAIGSARGKSWFESRPLFGKRFVVTRSNEQNGILKSKLEELGSEVIELPLIKILPTEERKQVAEVLTGIATYEWVVFTSSNGAREFMRLFFKAFRDLRSFGPMRIACVGEATAAIFRNYKLEVELIPEVSTAENLAQSLIATESLDSANILVVSGNRNREVLVTMLETIGHAIVDVLSVYETDFADVVNATDLNAYKKSGADGIIFTSSSTALSYVEQEEDMKLDESAKRPLLCSFGPETSKTLRENNLSVGLESESPSVDHLIDAILKKFVFLGEA